MESQHLSRFNRFSKLLIFVFFTYLAGLFALMVFRTSFIALYGNYSELSNFKFDLLRSYIFGFRFDTMVLTYGISLSFLLSFLSLVLPIRNIALNKAIERIFIILSVFVLTVFVIISFIDIYYYKFFSSHIDPFFFGIIDDDTKALLTSIWMDYPVVKLTIAIVVLGYLLYRLLKWIMSKNIFISFTSTVSKILFSLVIPLLFAMGMRCSFGHSPLQYSDASISSNLFINDIAINGIYAFKNSLKDRNSNLIVTDKQQILKAYNYSNEKDVLNDFFGNNEVDSNCNALWYTRTGINDSLKNNKPNILFIQMESFSNYYFDLHSDSLNLLGRLANELPHCIVFRNFFPSRNYTIHAIESILVNTPQSPISQSVYMNTAFPNSALIPLLENGYSTTFITGGRINWRNIDKFLPKQGFQVLEDGAKVKLHVPNTTEEQEWGVYDEFMFERIFQQLKSNSTNPKFIYGMTISNHPPYTTPTTYKPYSLDFPKSISKVLNITDQSVIANFRCFQYANDYVGKLISDIRNSELGENTIVVVTGDHATHSIQNAFKFTQKNLFQQFSVPLIMYVPDKYMQGFVDTTRFGSHNNIFPTIYNLSLSDTKYFKSGENMLDADTTKQFQSLFEYNMAFNKFGCVVFKENPIFLKWIPNSNHELSLCNDETVDSLYKLYNKSRASAVFSNFTMIEQVKSNNKH